MNTGIQEACNLAWKLGLIHAGVAHDPEGLLDSYEAERRPIALDVLRGTDLVTRAVTLRNPLLESLRNGLASLLTEFDFVRQRISVGVSELGIDYRKSPIVAEDRPGPMGLCPFPGPRAGDRVPDVTLDRAANDGSAGYSIACEARATTCCSSRGTAPTRKFMRVSAPSRGKSATEPARGSSPRS